MIKDAFTDSLTLAQNKNNAKNKNKANHRADNKKEVVDTAETRMKTAGTSSMMSKRRLLRPS